MEEWRQRLHICKPLETEPLPVATWVASTFFTLLNFFLGNTKQIGIIAATISVYVGIELRECG
jgi:hypothetical protein